MAISSAIPKERAELFAPLLNARMSNYKINEYPSRTAAFIANAIHESQYFTRLVESFRYKDPARLLLIFPRDFKNLADAQAVHAKGQEAIANRVYANQNGNGTEASGDGWRYRGRGIGMNTGKANYKEIQLETGWSLLTQPELLEQPDKAVDAYCLFWMNRNLSTPADNADFLKVCKIINGGKIGLAERTELYKKAVKVFGG